MMPALGEMAVVVLTCWTVLVASVVRVRDAREHTVASCLIADQAGGDETPSAAIITPIPLEQTPVADHVLRLLRWLQAADGVTGEILYRDLMNIYHEMCAEHRLQPCPWNVVSVEFTGLIGGRKTYTWVRDARGERHRLRKYVVPPADHVIPDSGNLIPDSQRRNKRQKSGGKARSEVTKRAA
jgi:hypothetical protein